MREHVGVEAVLGDFMTIDDLGAFDLVTFNKVLEHVEDPVAMLRRARQFVTPRGFVSSPASGRRDGGALSGAGREEFLSSTFMSSVSSRW